MNIMKFISPLIMSLALGGVAQGQFADVNPDNLDAVHDRTLIVVVEKPSDAITEKLNVKHLEDQLDNYKKAIDEFNKNFSDAITQYWKVSGGDVQYKTLDDINDITDKKNYAILFCRTVTQADMGSSLEANNGIMWWPDIKAVAHDKDFANKMTVMGVVLLDRIGKAPFYQVPMPDIYPTKADLEYAVNVANNYLNYRVNHRKERSKEMTLEMLQENQPRLKDKTLLLRRDWMDKRMTKAQMDKYYPFPYMIAGKDTIERLINADSSDYAVAMVVPYDMAAAPNGGLLYVQYAYDIDDGAILGSSGIPDMPASPKAGALNPASQTKPLINKRTLLDFSMYNEDMSDDSGNGKKKGRR